MDCGASGTNLSTMRVLKDVAFVFAPLEKLTTEFPEEYESSLSFDILNMFKDEVYHYKPENSKVGTRDVLQHMSLSLGLWGVSHTLSFKTELPHNIFPSKCQSTPCEVLVSYFDALVMLGCDESHISCKALVKALKDGHAAESSWDCYRFSQGWLHLYRQDYEDVFLPQLRATLPSLAKERGVNLSFITDSERASTYNNSNTSALQYVAEFDRYFDLVLDLVWCPISSADPPSVCAGRGVVHASSYQVYVTCVLSELVMKRAGKLLSAFPARALLLSRAQEGHNLRSSSFDRIHSTPDQKQVVSDLDYLRRESFQSHWYLRKPHNRLFFLLDICDMAVYLPSLLKIVTSCGEQRSSQHTLDRR